MKPKDSHGRRSRRKSTALVRSVKPVSASTTSTTMPTDTRYMGSRRRTRERYSAAVSNVPLLRRTRRQNRKPVIIMNTDTAAPPTMP